jgi:pyruvate dehydrogenase E2 component (dihydrolipoamide acetyltransferase)
MASANLQASTLALPSPWSPKDWWCRCSGTPIADLIALVDRARAGRLSPAEMQGGTFSITNLGAYRIDGFTPIVNSPETAILGVGRIAEKPVVSEGKIEARTMCTLSLSFDHRVVDGAPAAAFLARLAELLERPYALLGI